MFMKPFIKISVLATLLLLMGTSAKRRPTTLFMAGDSTMADKEEESCQKRPQYSFLYHRRTLGRPAQPCAKRRYRTDSIRP